MKKSAILVFTSVILFFGPAKGQSDTDTRKLRDFNTIKVSNSIKAELVKGDENQVTIKVSGIDVGKVETSVVGETLEIKLARGNYRNPAVTVIVTYVELLGIEANTSARVVSKNPIVAQEAYLSATNSSYLEAEMESDILHITAATNARIFVGGKAEELNIKAYTNAEVDGKKLTGDQVNVQANTAANVSFEAVKSLEGSVATAAKVFYGGNPKQLDVKSSTGGSIQKR